MKRLYYVQRFDHLIEEVWTCGNRRVKFRSSSMKTEAHLWEGGWQLVHEYFPVDEKKDVPEIMTVKSWHEKNIDDWINNMIMFIDG